MGYVYALLGAALFGLNGSLTKVIIEAGISPAQLTLTRTLTVAVLAGAWLLWKDRSAFVLTKRQLAVMAILGLTGIALLQWTYAMAISLLPVGVALLLEYLAVLAVAVIARVFFAEQVRGRLWVAVALVLVGMALVGEVWASQLNATGVLFGLLAATSLTVYFIVGERQVTATSPMAVAFWSMLFAAAFWLVFSAWWDIPVQLWITPASLDGALSEISAPLWILVLWCGVIGTLVPFVFSLLALKHLPVTTAGISASSEVVFAFLFAFLWLGEGLSAVQTIGAAIVLVAIVLAQTSRPGTMVDPDLMTSKLAESQLKS